jgi:hypothetical protein
VNRALADHRQHSTSSFPELTGCQSCHPSIRSWKAIAYHLWGGDPFGMRVTWMEPLEPEFFRPGAGQWGGTKAERRPV